MMTLREKLLSVADAFAAARGLSESRVSTMAFGDGKVITRLRAGSDLTTTRYEASMAWFDANWPADAVWPQSINRPLTPERFDALATPSQETAA